MAKQIVWTKTASQARREILKFWLEHTGNNKYSQKISKIFRERVKYISQFKYMGKQTEFKDVRVTACGHFSIFYKVIGKHIIIVGLWDNRRNPENIVDNLEI